MISDKKSSTRKECKVGILNAIFLTISLLLIYFIILIFVFKDEVVITSLKKITSKFY